NDIFTFYIENEAVTIVKYLGDHRILTIPSTLSGYPVSIDAQVFSDKDLLESIYVLDDNYFYASLNGVFYSKDVSTLLKYPEGKKDASFIIPNSVTNIS